MGMLTGPLGSYRGYIDHIVLPNCADYFDECEGQRSQGVYFMIRNKYKRLRLFLNAAESVNNIPDYIYHELKSAYGWNGEKVVRDKLAENNKIHETINSLANGYKHCVRNPPRKLGDVPELNADDFQSINFDLTVNLQCAELPETQITYSFDSIEDEGILAEAFRFWVSNDYKSLSEIFR